MNSKKNLNLIIYFVAALTMIIAGSVNAQHEGGLGIKKVYLNIADKDQLMKIEGMTDDIAEAIVDYREKSGFFKKPEDLLNVPGLTRDIYETLNPQVGSEGDLYCVPMESDEDDDYYDDDEEPILSPSKC